MSSITLDKLFGSRVRVKLLKFLFRNHPTEILTKVQESSSKGSFSAQELSKRIQEPIDDVKKELSLLEKLEVIKKIK